MKDFSYLVKVILVVCIGGALGCVIAIWLLSLILAVLS